MIQQLNRYEFFLKAHGNEMTLLKTVDGWEMFTVNATVRAFNRGFAIPKFFPTIEAVESKYKSWKGISKLIEEVTK